MRTEISLRDTSHSLVVYLICYSADGSVPVYVKDCKLAVMVTGYEYIVICLCH